MTPTMCVDTAEMREVANKVQLRWGYDFSEKDQALVEAWQLLINAANEIEQLRDKIDDLQIVIHESKEQ